MALGMVDELSEASAGTVGSVKPLVGHSVWLYLFKGFSKPLESRSLLRFKRGRSGC